MVSVYQSWTGPTKVIQKILEEINQQLFNKIIWKNVIWKKKRIVECLFYLVLCIYIRWEWNVIYLWGMNLVLHEIKLFKLVKFSVAKPFFLNNFSTKKKKKWSNHIWRGVAHVRPSSPHLEKLKWNNKVILSNLLP